MHKKIIISGLIITLLLNLTIKLIANESLNFSKNVGVSFNFAGLITKFKSASTEYMQNSKQALGVGIAGIPILTIGTGMVIAGGFLFDYYYYGDVVSTFISSIGGAAPSTWSYMKWIGLGILIGGGVIFIAGLVMIITGFVYYNYFKKKADGLTMNIFSDCQKGNARLGILVRI